MATQTWLEAIPEGSTRPKSPEAWAELRALPTLPAVLFRFLGLVGDHRTVAEELAEFVWKDPALLSRALPLATARAARRAEPNRSLKDSIALLGRERLRQLAFTMPLLRSFDPPGTASYALTYWERSLLCATACQAAAAELELENPERYYVAGLLHDIGYLVVLHKRPTLLPAILQQWAGRPTGLLEIEEELLGMDHTRLGLQVAARLNLEPWLLPAIGEHHNLTRESSPLARLTAIGAAFANYQGVDYFPRRSLSRTAREREMQEILRGLLPDVAEQRRMALLAVMEKAVQPVRNAIRETIVEWQLAGESRIRPHTARSQQPAIALAAIA